VTDAAPTQPDRSSPGLLVTISLALLAIAHAGYSAWSQYWTYDERFHLEWSARFIEEGITERTSRARFNSKTPVSVANVLAQRLTDGASDDDERWPRFAARLPTVLWLGVLLAALFGLGRSLVGRDAALIAVALAALDPNLTAHASLVTVDLLHALATLLTVWAALSFTRRPGALRGLWVGLSLGLAFATKFSAVLLLPCLLGLVVICRRRLAAARRDAVLGALVATCVAWVTLCSAYGFTQVGVPLSEVEWRSRPFSTLAETWPGAGIPVPAAFLTGLDVSLAAERAAWNVVILGNLHPTGVWYYFLLLGLLKTPLLSLLASLAGLGLCWRLYRGAPWARFIALVLLVHLGYFSLLFHAQIGYRFALMCLPLGYLLAAAGLAGCRARSFAPWVAVAVVLAGLAENAYYLGNPLSFTNAAVWPKRQVFRLIADSNVDWGQNRDKLEHWLEENQAANTRLDPVHLRSGHNTFSLNNLAGVGNFERHRWLRENVEPDGHFGHTYLWFKIAPELFDRFIGEQRSLETRPLDRALCPAELSYEFNRPGSWVQFRRREAPPPDQRWVVCVSIPKGADFGLQTELGHILFGRYTAPGRCETDRVKQRDVAWYRLGKGVHALCAEEIPNRRPHIRYYYQGRWLVRGRGAALHLRLERPAG